MGQAPNAEDTYINPNWMKPTQCSIRSISTTLFSLSSFSFFSFILNFNIKITKYIIVFASLFWSCYSLTSSHLNISRRRPCVEILQGRDPSIVVFLPRIYALLTIIKVPYSLSQTIIFPQYWFYSLWLFKLGFSGSD